MRPVSNVGVRARDTDHTHLHLFHRPRASCQLGCRPCRTPLCRTIPCRALQTAPCMRQCAAGCDSKRTLHLNAQGGDRGSGTHALRLFLCTCDEWTCSAAAECILRLQSGHRQCFSCAALLSVDPTHGFEALTAFLTGLGITPSGVSVGSSHRQKHGHSRSTCGQLQYA
jgi:hypothetical protein